MGTTVGNLAVNVVANIGGFTRNIRQVKTDTLGLSRSISESASGISSSFAGIAKGAFKQASSAALSFGTSLSGLVGISAAAALSVSALNARVTELGEAIDIAGMVGTTTRAIQELNFAAGQAGVAAGDMSASILRLTRSVGDAAREGKIDDAFGAIGLSSQLLALEPAEKQIRTIADAIAALTTPSEQAAVAQDLFGNAGIKLLPILRQGSSGIDKMAQGFSRLGGGISKVEAQMMEINNRKMALGGAAWDSMVNSMAQTWHFFKGEMADTFSFAVTGMTDMRMQMQKVAKSSSDLARHQADIAKRTREIAAQESAKKLADEMEKLQREADVLTRSLRTPFEIARDSIEEYQRLFHAGVLDAATFQRAVEKVGKEYIDAAEQASKLADVAERQKGSSVVLKGTTEAVAFEQSAIRQMVAEAAARKADLAEQKEHTRLLKQLLAAAKAKADGGIVLNEADIN